MTNGKPNGSAVVANGNSTAFREVARLLEQGRISGQEAFRLLLKEKRGRTGEGAAQVGITEPGSAGLEGSALEELEQMIGLDKVKEMISEFEAFLWVQKRRREAGLKAEPQVLHMVFKGNPGTGKTTVAGILGRLFRELGLLEKGHMVAVERADLVGEFIGHTAQKTRDHIKRALGGVLFIDEAYSLARGGEKDFGKEAIDTLVKGMEDHRNELVVILAGYRDEMEWFLRQNPGLRSRFPIHIEFPDYTVPELLLIADHMAVSRDYRLTDEARMVLAGWLQEPGRAEIIRQGNARLIRNIIEKAIRRQAVRIRHCRLGGREDMVFLTASDMRQALASQREQSLYHTYPYRLVAE